MRTLRPARRTIWPRANPVATKNGGQQNCANPSGKPAQRIVQRSGAGTYSVFGRPAQRLFQLNCS